MVTIQLSGGTRIIYIGVTFYLADGREVFAPTNGPVRQQGTFVSSSVTDFSDSVDFFGSVGIENRQLADLLVALPNESNH